MHISSRRFYLFGVSFLVGCAALNAALHAALYQSLDSPWHGSPGYGEIARQLLETGIYSQNGSSPTANRPPVYPLFLAFFFSIFKGSGISAAYLAQCFLWFANGLLLAAICRFKFQNTKAALLTLVLYGLHFQLGVEALTQRETILFAFFLSIYLAAILHLPHPRAGVIAGIATGLLYLTRPTGIIFLPALFLAIIPFSGSRLLRPHLRAFLLAAFAAFVVTLPWHWHTIAVMKSPGLLPASTSGENLYKGNFPGFSNISPWVDLDLMNPYLEHLTRDMEEIERNQTLKSLGWEYIRQSPSRALGRGIVKMASLYSPLRTPIGTGAISYVDGVPTLQHFAITPVSFWLLPQNLLILAGTLLFFLSWKNIPAHQRGFAIHLLWILLGLTAVHVLTFGETRHRLPFDGLLIIASALAYCRFIPSPQKADG
jgi:hypothetical protein